MKTLQRGNGDTWYARLGPFVVRVEPASVGYRADLGAWTGEGTIVKVGVYATLADADERAVTDAMAIMRAAEPCSCRFHERCERHRDRATP